jgi:hypothetical protein
MSIRQRSEQDDPGCVSGTGPRACQGRGRTAVRYDEPAIVRRENRGATDRRCDSAFEPTGPTRRSFVFLCERTMWRDFGILSPTSGRTASISEDTRGHDGPQPGSNMSTSAAPAPTRDDYDSLDAVEHQRSGRHLKRIAEWSRQWLSATLHTETKQPIRTSR